MKLVLYVTGSISCYKAYDLTRELSKAGHQIKIILSKGAQKFIKKELFCFLGALETYGHEDDFNHKEILHIELARWCDVMVVCPASANSLSTLANGAANDFGTSTYLALDEKKPCLIFPAMNTKMLQHPAVKRNLKLLKDDGRSHIFPTQSGVLACNEKGEGKLLSIENIKTLISSYPLIKTKAKKILLSTGASINPLDDVRFITNPATGVTGEEIARELLRAGHYVTVIYGGTNKSLFENFRGHPNLKLIKATTTNDFYHKTITEFSTTDVFISSAAISDMEFPYKEGKLKKKNLNGTLQFKQSTDILLEILNDKRADQKIIGFAAESELTQDLIDSKLERKPVDFLVATKVNSGISSNGALEGFSSNIADYKLFDGNKLFFEGKIKKSKLAEILSERISHWPL